MTKTRKFSRTSELISAPWWPISSSVCQVRPIQDEKLFILYPVLRCCFFIESHIDGLTDMAQYLTI